jgi:hypothetical protein
VIDTSYIGENRDGFGPGYKGIEFVSEGMRVITPLGDGTRRGMWCVVTVAAGMHARIVNTERGIAKWVHISTLCVPK